MKEWIKSTFRLRELRYFKQNRVAEVYDKMIRTNHIDKSKAKVKFDMIYSLFRYGCGYEEYFWFELFKCDKRKKKTYIYGNSGPKMIPYYGQLNSADDLAFFTDKYATYEKFKSYYGRDIIDIKRSESKDIEAFFKHNSKFVAKNTYGSLGKGVEIIDVHKFSDSDELIAYLNAENLNLCEQMIIQSNSMSYWHPHSVNTIRITTILHNDGDVRIFYPFIKVGRNGSIVDNAGAGGIIALIDPATGQLTTDGYDEKNVRYNEHPNTGVVFLGQSIPEWEEAVSLVKSLALIRPNCRYVGWDLAHTNNGWVVVEGNSKGHFIQQICDKVGRKAEMENIIKQINSYNADKIHLVQK